MFGFGIRTTGQGSPERAEKPAKGSKGKALGKALGFLQPSWKAVKNTLFCRNTKRVEPFTPQQDPEDPQIVSVQIFVNPNQTPEQVCLPGQICEDQESPCGSGSSRIDQTPGLVCLPGQICEDQESPCGSGSSRIEQTPGQVCLPGQICEDQESPCGSGSSRIEQTPGVVCLPGQICEDQESPCGSGPSRIEQTPAADPELLPVPDSSSFDLGDKKPAKGSKGKARGSSWKALKNTLFCRDTKRVEPSTPQQDPEDPEIVSVQIFGNPNQTPEQVCLPGQICEDWESPCGSGSSRIDQTPDADPEKAVLNTLLPRDTKRVEPSTPQQDPDEPDLESLPINVNPNSTPELPGQICEKQEFLCVSRSSSFDQMPEQVCLTGQIWEDQESPCGSGSSRIEQTPGLVCLPSQICEVRESPCGSGPCRIEQTPAADPAADKKTKNGSILNAAGDYVQNLFQKTIKGVRFCYKSVFLSGPKKDKKGTWKNSRYYTRDCFTSVYKGIYKWKGEKVEATIRIHKDDEQHLKDLKHSFPYEAVLVQVEQQRRLGRLSSDPPILTALYQFVGNEQILCVYKEKRLK